MAQIATTLIKKHRTFQREETDKRIILKNKQECGFKKKEKKGTSKCFDEYYNYSGMFTNKIRCQMFTLDCESIRLNLTMDFLQPYIDVCR